VGNRDRALQVGQHASSGSSRVGQQLRADETGSFTVQRVGKLTRPECASTVTRSGRRARQLPTTRQRDLGRHPARSTRQLNPPPLFFHPFPPPHGAGAQRQIGQVEAALTGPRTRVSGQGGVAASTGQPPAPGSRSAWIADGTRGRFGNRRSAATATPTRTRCERRRARGSRRIVGGGEREAVQGPGPISCTRVPWKHRPTGDSTEGVLGQPRSGSAPGATVPR